MPQLAGEVDRVNSVRSVSFEAVLCAKCWHWIDKANRQAETSVPRKPFGEQENQGFDETVSVSSSLPISGNSDGCARHGSWGSFFRVNLSEPVRSSERPWGASFVLLSGSLCVRNHPKFLERTD